MTKRILTTEEKPGVRTAVLVPVAREVEEGAEDSHEIEMSFSSEEPVERWGYEEVLDHSPGSVRLGQRQQNMPLLFNHNRDDLIGKVERVWLGDDRRLHCVARFAKTSRGAECEQMVRDGILTNVSFMYQIYDYREESKDHFRATDWEPFEVSLVTVPAHPTVGVGTALSQTNKGENVRSAQGDFTMDVNDNKTAIADAVSAERARTAEIDALCRQHSVDDNYRNHAVSEGLTVDQVRQHILENYRAQAAKPAASIAIDMSARERQQYSLLRAFRAMANHSSSGSFEREVSQELQRRYGLADTGGLYIPSDLGSRAWTGNDSLIPTEHHAEEYVSYLRERSVLVSLGARTLSGLRGNVDIPKGTGGATTYWGVDKDITASDYTFGNVTMSMKQVGALTTVPRSLLMQSSPDAEQLVRDDFFGALAEAVDTAAINGDSSDSDVPTGLINLTGVGTIELGTVLSPGISSLTWKPQFAIPRCATVALLTWSIRQPRVTSRNSATRPAARSGSSPLPKVLPIRSTAIAWKTPLWFRRISPRELHPRSARLSFLAPGTKCFLASGVWWKFCPTPMAIRSHPAVWPSVRCRTLTSRFVAPTPSRSSRTSIRRLCRRLKRAVLAANNV